MQSEIKAILRAWTLDREEEERIVGECLSFLNSLASGRRQALEELSDAISRLRDSRQTEAPDVRQAYQASRQTPQDHWNSGAYASDDISAAIEQMRQRIRVN